MMNFSQALEQLKQGQKLARTDWNGKGMYIFLVEADRSDLAFIMMSTAQGYFVPWVASHTDLLSENWGVVN